MTFLLSSLFVFYMFSRSMNADHWNSVLVSVFAVAALWLISQFLDAAWCRFKFPKTFTGTNAWKGKWTSSKYKRTSGKIFVVFPTDFAKTGAFNASALLYTSLFSNGLPGKFRKIDFNGRIEEGDLSGIAQISDSRSPNPVEVNFKGLVAPEFKQIAGGYKEPSDVGTFWIREDP